MKKLIIGLCILGGLAFITNPNEQKHKEAVKKAINDESGSEIGNSLKGFLVNNTIIREDHYVYSTTKLKVLGQEKVVGYGFFTLVFINTDELKINPN